MVSILADSSLHHRLLAIRPFGLKGKTKERLNDIRDWKIETTRIGVSDSLGRVDENLNFRPLKGSERRTR